MADSEGRTPLLVAANRKSWATVSLLLEMNASTDVLDNRNRNILHLIIRNGAPNLKFSWFQTVSESGLALACINTFIDYILKEKYLLGCPRFVTSWHPKRNFEVLLVMGAVLLWKVGAGGSHSRI